MRNMKVKCQLIIIIIILIIKDFVVKLLEFTV